MSKPITEIDDPRLVKALAHPLRARIIAMLEEAPASPKQLAEALNMPLENVSYHVKKLVQLGLILLDHTRTTRGAVQHFYVPMQRPVISSKAWDELPQLYRDAAEAAAITETVDLLRAAAIQGQLGRPESHVQRFRFAFDAQAFSEAVEVFDEVIERFAEIEKTAQGRGHGRGTQRPTVYVGMLFEAPRPDGDPAPDA
jgi:DNA-binding transcriptional ArsR family regulator